MTSDFLMVQQVTGVVVLLVLGVELPVVPLGPLGECLPRVVLHPSILPPNLFSSREKLTALSDFCKLS